MYTHVIYLYSHSNLCIRLFLEMSSKHNKITDWKIVSQHMDIHLLYTTNSKTVMFVHTSSFLESLHTLSLQKKNSTNLWKSPKKNQVFPKPSSTPSAPSSPWRTANQIRASLVACVFDLAKGTWRFSPQKQLFKRKISWSLATLASCGGEGGNWPQVCWLIFNLKLGDVARRNFDCALILHSTWKVES